MVVLINASLFISALAWCMTTEGLNYGSAKESGSWESPVISERLYRCHQGLRQEAQHLHGV